MTVFWTGVLPSGGTNRFAAKHLHQVDAHFNIQQMEAEGFRILRERNNLVPVVNKKAKYGGIKPPANTLIVTNRGGMQSMTAWIEKYVTVSTKNFILPLKMGVIVQNSYNKATHVFTEDAKVGGSVDISVEVSGSDKYVYHMNGVDAADAGDVYTNFKMNLGGVSFEIPL
jgi:hypothetical protein